MAHTHETDPDDLLDELDDLPEDSDLVAPPPVVAPQVNITASSEDEFVSVSRVGRPAASELHAVQIPIFDRGKQQFALLNRVMTKAMMAATVKALLDRLAGLPVEFSELEARKSVHLSTGSTPEAWTCSAGVLHDPNSSSFWNEFSQCNRYNNAGSATNPIDPWYLSHRPYTALQQSSLHRDRALSWTYVVPMPEGDLAPKDLVDYLNHVNGSGLVYGEVTLAHAADILGY